jgi:hypothetical protein
MHGSELIHKSNILLKKKFDDFIKYNPQFGRKIISLNRKKIAIRNISYNMNHPKFTIADIKKNNFKYDGTISSNNSSYSYSDSDEDEDDDYESNDGNEDDYESGYDEEEYNEHAQSYSNEYNVPDNENQPTEEVSIIVTYNRLIELGEIIENTPSIVEEENKSNEEDDNITQIDTIIINNISICDSNHNDDDIENENEINNNSDSDSEVTENINENAADIDNLTNTTSSSNDSQNSNDSN